MSEYIDLDDTSKYLLMSNPSVYIGCSLTSDDRFGCRAAVLEIAHDVFSTNGFDVYNPSRFTSPGSPHQPTEVYTIDYLNVVGCDLVFFIHSQTSLGLGLEGQIGSDHLIPWGDAKATTSFNRITPLMSGLANPKAGAHVNFPPNSPDEFREKLESVVTPELRDRVLAIKRGLRPTRQSIKKLNLGLLFRAQRFAKNVSARDLGIRLGVKTNWILSLEEADELFGGVSVGQLHSLMFELGLKFHCSEPDGCHLPKIVQSHSVDNDLLDLAIKYSRYTLRARRPGELGCPTDDEMMAHWEARTREKGYRLPSKTVGSNCGLGETQPLRISVSMPMSCLDDGQKSLVQVTTKAIKNALNARFGPSVVNVEVPEFWKEVGEAPREHNGGKVYADTISRLSDCDVGIIVTFPPATGVGVCGQIHANLGIPAIIVSPSENDISRMLLGAPFRQLSEPVKGTDTNKICDDICNAVQANLPQLRLNSSRNRAHRDHLGSMGFEAAICRQQIISGKSELEVFNEIKNIKYIRQEWIEYFLKTPNKIQHMSLLQFLNISDKMGWEISSSNGHLEWCPQSFPNEFDLSEKQRIAARRSLESLMAAKNRIETQDKKAGRMFSMPIEEFGKVWSGYVDELTLDAADHQRESLERTTDQWMKVLANENGF
jgi:hypothetical protein